MITYSKTINSLEAYTSIDGYSNVVFIIYWTLIGEENGVKGTSVITTYVPYISGQAFTPYSQLTEEQINNWIDLYTPLTFITQAKKTINEEINQQQQTVTLPVPWATQAN